MAETLAGRARIIQLPPFTLSEGFAHARGEDPTTDGLSQTLLRLLRGRLTTTDFQNLVLGAYAEPPSSTKSPAGVRSNPTTPELRFWAKTAASEVDLVVSNRGYHIPFEIKLGATFNPRWLHGLDAFDRDHRHLGVEVPYCFIVHSGEPEVVDERTFAMPLWLLA